MGEYEDKVFEVIEQGEQAQEKTESRLFTLSQGVVLRPRRFAVLIVTEIQRRFKEPPIPKVFDENKKREINNPNDPTYQRALENALFERGMAITDVLIGLGTDLEELPPDILGPDDKWEEEILPFLPADLTIPKKGRSRYLAWLKYFLDLSGEELQGLLDFATRGSGISQAEVSAAVASFPNNPPRTTD